MIMERKEVKTSLVNFKTGKLISVHGEELEKARMESPLINKMMAAGAPMEDIVVVLHGFIMDLLQENLRMEQICPRKTQAPDGTMKVWHCPDEMIPLTVITSEKVETPANEVDIIGTCDVCGKKILEMQDLGFMGDESDSTDCSPMTNIVTRCKECEDKNHD